MAKDMRKILEEAKRTQKEMEKAAGTKGKKKPRKRGSNKGLTFKEKDGKWIAHLKPKVVAELKRRKTLRTKQVERQTGLSEKELKRLR